VNNKNTRSIIYRVPIRKDFPVVHAHYAPAEIVKKEYYNSAKRGGDMIAASAFVQASINPDLVNELKKEFDRFNPIICPVSAIEEKGRVPNLIPQAFGLELSVLTDWRIDMNIIQTNRTKHTGAYAINRLMRQPTYSGKILSGEYYFLVDDHMTLGGTLANLYGHIVTGNGIVCGISSLAFGGKRFNSEPTRQLQMSDEIYQKLLMIPAASSFANFFNNEFGFGLESLTHDEARAIISHRCMLPNEKHLKPIRDLALEQIYTVYRSSLADLER
jgi:hypothetical protein